MTDSNTVDAPFRVNETFIANDYADLIIRSSDGHDFHVLKGLLAMVSTIFKDMFSLPQMHQATEPDATHSLSIVNVSESAPVVDALLRYIYPVGTPEITSIDIAFGVLFAAQKYEMDLPLHYVTDVISDLQSCNAECVLKSFAIACTHRLPEQVRASASASLRINLMDTEHLDALDNASGKAVVRLLRYHAEVRQKLAKLFSGKGFPYNVTSTVRCYKCESNRICYSSKWWADMLGEAEQDVYIKGPMSTDVFSQDKVRNAFLNACTDCMPRVLRFGIDKLYDCIMDTIKKVIEEVEFEIPWAED